MVDYESKFESRFYYVEDDNLRKHMGDALEFISDLLGIAGKFPDKNRNYFYKTCILYTASLIESHLNYGLVKLGFTEIESNDWKYSNMREAKIITLNGDDVKIVTGKREKKKVSLSGEVDFNSLIDFSRKQEIIDESMKENLHKIRKKRNQIHLMDLKDIDRIYSKQIVDDIFKIARELFKIIEKRMKKNNQII